jgi:hypothetical protein
VSGSLARVLRLRALFENVSRVEVERRSRSLARVEGAIERERDQMQENRRVWVESLSGAAEEDKRETAAGPAQGKRAVAEADQSLTLSRIDRLEPLRAREAQQLEQARELWKLRHKERRQVEVVMEARAREAKIEEERRVQRSLDDWFQLRHAQSAARQRAEQKAQQSTEQNRGPGPGDSAAS